MEVCSLTSTRGTSSTLLFDSYKKMSPNDMRARSNKQHCLEINAFFLAKCSLFALLNQYIGTDKIDPMILWALSNLAFVFVTKKRYFI